MRRAAGVPQLLLAQEVQRACAIVQTVGLMQDAVRAASPAVLQQYLAALSRGNDAAVTRYGPTAASPASGPLPSALQSLLNTAAARLHALAAPAAPLCGSDTVGAEDSEGLLGELLSAGWTMHVAVGMSNAQLRLHAEGRFEVDAVVPQIARMLVMRACDRGLGDADVLLCAQAVRLSDRAEGMVARGWEPPGAWRRAVQRLGLAAAESLAAAPAGAALPLSAYADVAAAATPGGAVDTRPLRRWATGRGAAAALRAATPAAAGEARAAAKLVRAAAAGAADAADMAELQTAAAKYAAAAAPTLPMPCLAVLTSALHYSNGRTGKSAALSAACAALERELILRCVTVGTADCTSHDLSCPCGMSSIACPHKPVSDATRHLVQACQRPEVRSSGRPDPLQSRMHGPHSQQRCRRGSR